MVSYRVIIIELMSVFCSSCGNTYEEGKKMKQEDTFYNDIVDGDLYRIPLVEPIEIISAYGVGGDWILRLPYNQVTEKKSMPVIAVSVLDSVIIVDTGVISIPGENTQVWVIIDVKNQAEFLCKTVSEYHQKLSDLGLKPENLHEVNEVYSSFKKSKKLPWENYGE